MNDFNCVDLPAMYVTKNYTSNKTDLNQRKSLMKYVLYLFPIQLIEISYKRCTIAL